VRPSSLVLHGRHIDRGPMTAHHHPVPARPDHLVLRFVLVGVVAVTVALLSTLVLAAVNPPLFEEHAAPAATRTGPPAGAPSLVLETMLPTV
jgi:hypothetical protein